MGTEYRERAYPARPRDGTVAVVRPLSPKDPDLSDELASAYNARDLDTFTELLSEWSGAADPADWQATAAAGALSTLLRRASGDQGRGAYVRALLAAGVDPNRVNPFPLHLAAAAANAESLQELLRAEGLDVNRQDKWGTALHAAVARQRLAPKVPDTVGGWVEPSAVALSAEKRDELEHGYRRCVQLLMRHPRVDFNMANGDGLTAVHQAAQGDAPAAMLQLLLTEGGSDLNVDSGRDSHGRTARDAIRDRHPQLASRLPPHALAELSADKLFFYLYSRESEQFLAALQQPVPRHENKASLLDADDGTHTLLQLASKDGLYDAVKALLQGGADPNRTGGERATALALACLHGHHRVVRALVSDSRTDLRAGRPLHAAIKGAAKAKAEPQQGGEARDHHRCVQILLARGVDVHALDETKAPALYHAARNELADMVRTLLKAGANVGQSDGSTAPINYMSPAVLRTHFDQCISTNGLSPLDKEYEVIFDYSNLSEPCRRQGDGWLRLRKRFQAAKAEPEPASNREEDAVQSAGLGGGQVDSYGWRDPAAAAEGGHGQAGSKPGKQVAVQRGPAAKQGAGYRETATLLYLAYAEDPRMQELLTHPLLTSYLHLKWRRVKAVYIVSSLILHLVFSLLVTFYAILRDVKFGGLVDLLDGNRASGDAAGTDATPKISEWDVQCSFALMGVLIFYSVWELLRVWPRLPHFFSLNDFLAVVSIPVLAMLIATNLQVLLSYGVLMAAFALSFYILFHNCSSGTGQCVQGGDDDDDEFFHNPFTSIFKTFVMLTGEFDASSLPFKAFPGTSHVLFLLFVFLVSIVLFNLLLGLAVSDTAVIRKDAELWAYVTRAEHLYFTEIATVTHLSTWVPFPSPNLFQDERERRVRVLCNEGNRVLFPSAKSGTVQKCCCLPRCFKRFCDRVMDPDIMKDVSELLQGRNAQADAI
ncbi:transient receptor potential cation channel protein painless isoform X2 [Thrips palmi]|uniref:Transient receptor potential cation channel protein painless isoform X2 n=1 Tax=Thrips palmi TaxID=161013 RepID=A0A6P8ZQU0_THRPL|nr:transient receptor potential cation channel protein painless isoform X2 [Thrips palmi]